jgi:dihydroneopterin aldolase/2-amino-4-hydroxy-6-hydroxymethyldihydropteridine diphosphokinase
MGGIFIGVGSNIDPPSNIRKAFALLDAEVRIVNISTFYLTEPEGRPKQPPFFNGALEIETSLNPRALKVDLLLRIEVRLGRVRTADRYAARTIDLDLLLFGDLVISEPGLDVPDPEISKRPFLALPLHELAPEMVLPDSGLPIVKLAARFAHHDMTPLEKLSEELRKRYVP